MPSSREKATEAERDRRRRLKEESSDFVRLVERERKAAQRARKRQGQPRAPIGYQDATRAERRSIGRAAEMERDEVSSRRRFEAVLDRQSQPIIVSPDGDTRPRGERLGSTIGDVWGTDDADGDLVVDPGLKIARQMDVNAPTPHGFSWANRGHRRGRVWVSDFSHQFLSGPEDQVFEVGEVTELWEAARLEIVGRRSWLRLHDEYVTRIALELEKGPRPRSEFPAWLRPLLTSGFRRLRHEGYLIEQEKPNVWYRGRGKPRNYLVTVYSLKPEPRRTYEKTGT